MLVGLLLRPLAALIKLWHSLISFWWVLPSRSGVEQSFSKADRCYHTGRFGPKAADTERRSISVLTMSGKESQKDIIEGARQLYAAAVKRHKGRQAKPRFDKGTKKKKHPKSEHTFLEKRKLLYRRPFRNL